MSGVDEAAITADSHAALVQALGTAKARAVADGLTGPGLVLGCDSMLEFGPDILGKPASAAEAIERWQRMRGAEGVLLTGHCLIDLATGRTAEQVVGTEVNFADVTDQEIENYVASGEPLVVAGAFTIDGLGGWFVESIVGDHHNVVGLSLPALRRMLATLGYAIADLPPV